ncbi:hypothetical protein EKO23_00975 [Nocardioides guangzhouensis]|uniref:Uncharacterized protein n=1 Tax=Nocardioides guangzhouensis TaxID=2497878 RepID=A0A4Q4ZKZ8_9ACTN|nr:hypothetical protein [Nocardioides guangzhouensis]RYP89033.1 hypothetical protein EKO23_00975 [Nocardioides guangzhouensis]
MTLYTYDPATPEKPGGTRVWAFVGGALAGALVVAIVWWGATALDPEAVSTPPAGDQQRAALSGDHPDDAAASPASSRDTGGTTYLTRCREVFAAQERPLKAAAASLAQWQVHIGAMNKLVTGVITLDQATQFWDQTRVGASRRLERAAAGRRHFDRRTARCPAPPASARRDPEERTCHRAVAARNQTMRLATTALGTWQEHVHHMEMLRRGEMTPEEATQMWLQSWHTGNDQVRAYRAAAAATRSRC